MQLKPTFFAKPSDFRKWLQRNHKKETELLVGFYKVGSGKQSMTWPQSVDEALCFGWIDAIRRTIDEESYSIRFTKRKPNSIWSIVNIKKVEALAKKGLVRPAGLEAFKQRTESKSGIYSHEKEAGKLSSKYERDLKANKKAWNYFQSLAPGYKKLSVHWVMDAKQEATQLKRLKELISDCEKLTNRWKDNKYK
ncbi:MAG: YdeI/OmpD-associated family protein [Bacteroidia bacterium]